MDRTIKLRSTEYLWNIEIGEHKVLWYRFHPNENQKSMYVFGSDQAFKVYQR